MDFESIANSSTETPNLDPHQALSLKPLRDLVLKLDAASYHFICPTPETHQHVVQKRCQQATKAGQLPLARNVRDAFGWSLPFCLEDVDMQLDVAKRLLDLGILSVINDSDTQQSSGNSRRIYKSAVRISTFQSTFPHVAYFHLIDEPAPKATVSPLYLHSAWPTSSDDAIFFGPDTYRYLRFLDRAYDLHFRQPGSMQKVRMAVDIGCGAGAGALHTGGWRFVTKKIIGLDINPKALHFAAFNEAMGQHKHPSNPWGSTPFEWRQSDLYDRLTNEEVGEQSELDLIVSNPPFIAFASVNSTGNDALAPHAVQGGHGPIYANGGSNYGLNLALEIVKQGLPRLAVGGHLMLYTGVPVKYGGRDTLHDALITATDDLEKMDAQILSYEVLDVDIFGEEILSPAYDQVERIAAVGVVIRRDEAPDPNARW